MAQHQSGERLTMSERRAVTRQMAPRYQAARKKQRGQLLEQFVRLTRYSRSYAAFVLRNWGRKRVLTFRGIRTIYVLGEHRKRRVARRPRHYNKRLLPHLTKFWMLSGGLCGKRLVPFIRTTLPVLERFEELCLDTTTRQMLFTISPATADRMLAPVRKRSAIKGRSTTKPGTLLKHQIPIRTFSEWNEQAPGFVEIDLVAHDGGLPGSDVIHTLDLTDVYTGWTETRALKTKAQRWVLEALADITQHLPFPIWGIDSDNGGEFINAELLRYCLERKITFTRSRPYRKNDSCFVEQKNYSIVRKTVGYARYDNDAHLHLLVMLYRALRLFTNFFQPVMKLKTKTRNGSKVTKTYDYPETPYARLLRSPQVPRQDKRKLQRLYRTLNPAALKRTIIHLQEQLIAMTSARPLRRQQQPITKTNFKKIFS